MSLVPPIRVEKYCFVYCGPDRCDCMAGAPLELPRDSDAGLAEKPQALSPKGGSADPKGIAQ